MLIISGTGLKLEELPHYDSMNYVLESDLSLLDIKLRTVAKQNRCLGVYINSALKGTVREHDGSREKTYYFSSDTELLKMLQPSGVAEEPAPVTPVVAEQVIETPVVKREEVKPEPPTTYEITSDTPVKAIIGLKLETVEDNEPEEAFLELPHISEDTNSTLLKLEAKDGLIRQKEARIKELTEELDESYSTQEVYILEMRSKYESLIADKTRELARLEERIKDIAVPDDIKGFLKYAAYSKNPMALVKEGFYEEELERLTKTKSSIHVFASSGGESQNVLNKQLLRLVNEKEKTVVVDFSNDLYLFLMLKIKNGTKNSLRLTDTSVPVKDLVHEAGNMSYITTALFNDIALLDLDWITIINRVTEYANGRKVVFIFNSISSFAVKHTFSRLATLGDGSLFAKASPPVLANLYKEVRSIPSDRFSVVSVDYIEKTLGILKKLGEVVSVSAYPSDVDWKKVLNRS